MFQLVNRFKCRIQHVLDSITVRITGNLINQPDFVIARKRDCSGIIIACAGQYSKQGGFSGAVTTKNTHTFALMNLKCQSL